MEHPAFNLRCPQQCLLKKREHTRLFSNILEVRLVSHRCSVQYININMYYYHFDRALLIEYCYAIRVWDLAISLTLRATRLSVGTVAGGGGAQGAHAHLFFAKYFKKSPKLAKKYSKNLGGKPPKPRAPPPFFRFWIRHWCMHSCLPNRLQASRMRLVQY